MAQEGGGEPRRQNEALVRHARLMIGDMYHDGNGVRKDGLEALKWYLASAQLFEQDDEWYTRFSMSDKDTGRTFASLERESNIFLRVIAGRRKDALACLMKAAEEGSIDAAKLLAGMFGSGVGTDKDLIRAARWCRTAAEQGDAESQRMPGGMYRIGQGVAKDVAGPRNGTAPRQSRGTWNHRRRLRLLSVRQRAE